VFESITTKITGILDKIKRKGSLTEADVETTLKDIRIALLEADVALPVVKSFTQKVRDKAVGQQVIKSVTPGNMVVKIVYDSLVEVLTHESHELDLDAKKPVVIMLIGLQGAGKTTTAAKLAKMLKQEKKKKVLLVSTDIYRPAAREQLSVLANSIDVDMVPIFEEGVKSIVNRAMNMANLHGYDILIVDTAGRLHINKLLMTELKTIYEICRPKETLLVVDGMIGQDSYKVAHAFKEEIQLTGLILTRMDGDGRGGAALSLCDITNCPIKFLGLGEKVETLEHFQPSRIADRILGMGDVVTLVERATELIDKDEAEKIANRMQRGKFNLEDMHIQLKQMIKIGGFKAIMEMIPVNKNLKDQLRDITSDEKTLKKQCAIICSMTVKEKVDPKLINSSRRKRIASGSGTTVQDVNRLLKQFYDMYDMMKKVHKLGNKTFLRSKIKDFLGL
jgi:signal recognition particle subunit SRP54